MGGGGEDFAQAEGEGLSDSKTDKGESCPSVINGTGVSMEFYILIEFHLNSTLK